MTTSDTPVMQRLPPEDFQEIPSKVNGIRVFAKKETLEPQLKIETFKCPQCGAATKFNVAAGGVACEHCGFSVSIEAETAGMRAAENEFTLEALAREEKGWGEERRILHCTSCGAEVAIIPNTISSTCPFCASNEVNLIAPDANILQPKYLIPFKVLPESNNTRTKEWLGKGWFHPDELAASAIIDRFTGIYMPFWTFDANITADWNAEVGYERTERYYDSDSKTWKTRVEIDWRWENGQINLPVDDLIVTGNSHISQHILKKILNFQMNDLTAYAASYLAGWQAQAYDITLPAAWESGKAVMREQAKDQCYADIPTSHVRNFSMKADFADESWRYVLLPVFLAAYRFEGKVYQVMVNGQTGEIAGQKPVAWWKVWLAIAAMLAPGIIAGMIGLPLLLAGGIGVVPLFIGFVLLIIGGIFAFSLYKKAKDSEAA